MCGVTQRGHSGVFGVTAGSPRDFGVPPAGLQRGQGDDPLEGGDKGLQPLLQVGQVLLQGRAGLGLAANHGPPWPPPAGIGQSRPEKQAPPTQVCDTPPEPPTNHSSELHYLWELAGQSEPSTALPVDSLTNQLTGHLSLQPIRAQQALPGPARVVQWGQR